MTNFIYNNVERICAISDIHGDLDGLIIALRDCARIIDYKENFNVQYYDIEKKKDINENKDYDTSLGFRWCGNKTHLVIVGDVIDNVRPHKIKKGKLGTRMCGGKRDFELFNEDIKILLFLQYLMNESFKNEGRVILLCGNHEYKNFYDLLFVDDYNSKFSLEQKYKCISRKLLFRHCEGINLLKNTFENNKLGVMAKINNYIFVHAGLNPHLLSGHLKLGDDKVNDLVTSINDNFNKLIVNGIRNYNIQQVFKSQKKNNTDEYKDIFLSTMEPKEISVDYAKDKNGGILWTRLFSDLHRINSNEDDLCNDLYKLLFELEKDIKLVVGHCPQYESMAGDNYLSEHYDTADFTMSLKNRTYVNTYYDGNRFIISSNEKGLYNLNDPLTYYGTATQTHLFGMTVGCPNKKRGDVIKNVDYKIYRIDTGFSRAFDFYDFSKYMDSANSEIKKKFLMTLSARSPSILELTPHKNSILRSTLQNTLIHQKRSYIDLTEPKLLQLIIQIDQTNINDDIKNNDMYYMKYVKYKTRYLQLSKNMCVKK